MPIIQHGLKPVIIDCEINNLNVSRKNLEERYRKNPDIKCFFLTNTLGFCADISQISEFCKQKNIIFLEDNCESLGSKIDGKLLGNFGFASTFSFFVGHHMSTIEGGMICTDDKKLADALCLARAHGWDRNLDEEAKSEIRKKFNINPFLGSYTFYDLAYNVRPTEINGFLGCEQLKYLDTVVRKRFENFKKFNKEVNSNPDCIALKTNHMGIVSNFAFPLILKTKELCEKYKEKFQKNGVEIRPVIAGNIQRQPFYKKYVQDSIDCKNAEFVHNNGFYFGNNPELTKKEIRLITKLIKNKIK
jgi:CDP-6-deoxy-D-xylo-4-hexulose-3-dehydrase